jgi:hypothetical protein
MEDGDHATEDEILITDHRSSLAEYPAFSPRARFQARLYGSPVLM